MTGRRRELRPLCPRLAELIEDQVGPGINVVSIDQSGVNALFEPAACVPLADALQPERKKAGAENRRPSIEPAEVVHHGHEPTVEHLAAEREPIYGLAGQNALA
jgi:hypothetical protein